MKERPIPFSAPMVLSIRADEKTQTRRIIKPRRDRDVGCELAPHELAGEVNAGIYSNAPWAPGDRLWVREAWRCGALHDPDPPRRILEGTRIHYTADGPPDEALGFGRWRPAMFMPRWASRITLAVTGVRAERLRNISEADARAEGIAEFIGGWACLHDDAPQIAGATPQEGFRHLWSRINGPDAWAANPWVWVVSFQAARKAAP